MYQEQISAGISNYIPQILWDVITCPSPWYLLLAHRSSYVYVLLYMKNTFQCSTRFAGFHQPVFNLFLRKCNDRDPNGLRQGDIRSPTTWCYDQFVPKWIFQKICVRWSTREQCETQCGIFARHVLLNYDSAAFNGKRLTKFVTESSCNAKIRLRKGFSNINKLYFCIIWCISQFMQHNTQLTKALTSTSIITSVR